MLLEVYRCVQLQQGGLWYVGVFCIGDSKGEGWCVSSTLCRYDIRMGL